MVVLYAVLVLLGILLIVIELVVLPGVGVAGIGGTLLVLAGVLAFSIFTERQPDSGPWP